MTHDSFRKEMAQIWSRFIQQVALDAFGEKEMINEGKKVKVLYGSVEAHKKLFDKAVDEHLKDMPDEADFRRQLLELKADANAQLEGMTAQRDHYRDSFHNVQEKLKRLEGKEGDS